MSLYSHVSTTTLSLLCSHRKKLADVNKKLGEKFEISETELMSTLDACRALLSEGQDLDTGEGATQVRTQCRQQDLLVQQAHGACTPWHVFVTNK